MSPSAQPVYFCSISWELHKAAGIIISASSSFFSKEVMTAYTLGNFAKKEGEIMSNLETTENKSLAKKMDLAGTKLELLNFNTAC